MKNIKKIIAIAFHEYVVTDLSSACYKKRYVYGFMPQITMANFASIIVMIL